MNDIDPLEALYGADDEEMEAFGANWTGPAHFRHGEQTLVARYTALNDGRAVEVYCTALPARFYALRAAAAVERSKPYEMRTGSGIEMAQLMALMAKAIAEGMLDLRDEEDD